MKQKRSCATLAHSCAIQEKNTHRHTKCFPPQSRWGETVWNSVHPQLQKYFNLTGSLFCCRGISSYTLTPKAAGAAICSYATRGPGAKSFQVTAGEEEVPRRCRCGVTEKTLAAVSGCQPLELFITHHGRVLRSWDLLKASIPLPPPKKKKKRQLMRGGKLPVKILLYIVPLWKICVFVLQVVGCVRKGSSCLASSSFCTKQCTSGRPRQSLRRRRRWDEKKVL